MVYLSERIRAIGLSPTLSITALASQMREEGEDVISLSAGEPDFETPERVKEAALLAIEEGFTHYTPAGGINELKDAILFRAKEDQGLSYTRDEVCSTNGGKQALYQAFQALLDPGDEVLIPLPYWVSYPEQVQMAGGVPVFVKTHGENSFKMRVEDLEKALTEKSRVLVLNSPQNPTGHLYTKEELEAFIPLILEKGLTIVSDEVYEHIVFDKRAVSIASLHESMRERTIIINGLSKSHAMTGWRVGYALGPEEVISSMTRLQSHLTSNINSIAQKAAIAALRGPFHDVERMVEEFKARRDLMVQGINQTPYFSCLKPEGAFYLWVDIRELLEIRKNHIENDHELCQDLLQKKQIATIPGSSFGVEGYLRLSYAASLENLKEALRRIGEYVEGC